jgi:hypothetical protein
MPRPRSRSRAPTGTGAATCPPSVEATTATTATHWSTPGVTWERCNGLDDNCDGNADGPVGSNSWDQHSSAFCRTTAPSEFNATLNSVVCVVPATPTAAMQCRGTHPDGRPWAPSCQGCLGALCYEWEPTDDIAAMMDPPPYPLGNTVTCR